MTTDEAFAKLLNTQFIARELGIKHGTFGSLKNSFFTGRKTVSLDKKVELLKKAGYTIEQEIVWGQPVK